MQTNLPLATPATSAKASFPVVAYNLSFLSTRVFAIAALVGAGLFISVAVATAAVINTAPQEETSAPASSVAASSDTAGHAAELVSDYPPGLVPWSYDTSGIPFVR